MMMENKYVMWENQDRDSVVIKGLTFVFEVYVLSMLCSIPSSLLSF